MKFLTDEDVTLVINKSQLKNFFTNLKEKIIPKEHKHNNNEIKLQNNFLYLKKDFSKIVLTKESGSGAFGSVWTGKLNNSTNNQTICE